jgi:hypothetical protein
MANKQINKPKIISLLITSFFLTTIFISLQEQKNRQNLQSAAAPKNKNQVTLLTSDSKFHRKKTTVLDFSQIPCCRTLTNQYLAQYGIKFDDNSGWNTYQANNFVGHLSTAPTLPGAPTGITGTKLELNNPTKAIGMYIQAGSPFVATRSWSAKKITIKAYDQSHALIFNQSTDTCLGEATSCTPKFIGVQTFKPRIKTLEITIDEPYSWSIDDMKWSI